MRIVADQTGLVAKLIQLFGSLDAKEFLEAGKRAAFVVAPGGEPYAANAARSGRRPLATPERVP
jgi:hypothetical protein